jgi:hypothetical protein
MPRSAAPAEGYLRESASPYTLPTLLTALDDVITMLSTAIRDAGPSDNPAQRGTASSASLHRSR